MELGHVSLDSQSPVIHSRQRLKIGHLHPPCHLLILLRNCYGFLLVLPPSSKFSTTGRADRSIEKQHYEAKEPPPLEPDHSNDSITYQPVILGLLLCPQLHYAGINKTYHVEHGGDIK